MGAPACRGCSKEVGKRNLSAAFKDFAGREEERQAMQAAPGLQTCSLRSKTLLLSLAAASPAMKP